MGKSKDGWQDGRTDGRKPSILTEEADGVDDTLRDENRRASDKAADSYSG